MPTTRQIIAAELSSDTTHPQLHIISPTLQNANTKKGNAGTSTKTPDIAPVVDLYARAPSGKPSRIVMSASRNTGREVKQSQSHRSITVPMLEKHPFTSQQFIPMGGTTSGSYVVVVADSLEDGKVDARSIRAFLVRGDEGISYGAGLWHAPMAVITEVSLVFRCSMLNIFNVQSVDFAIVQYSNSVPEEDCVTEDLAEPLEVVF
jgi:ureidoglycolate lyase